MSDAKFPRPWKAEPCNSQELIVTDANGTKLFYIVGDEGDGDEAKPSALYWSDDPADTEYLLNEIMGRIELRNKRA